MLQTKHAFSLVELSIVLVILGLLTGGILGGQSLIRAAELRSVSTEATRYVTAAQTFRDKYFALPGDFRDATRFWGRMNGNADCVTNSSAAVNSAGACDGNGNGSLEAAGAASGAAEFAQLWRQLQLAGLVEGTYSGLSGAGGTWHCVIGTDCPRSKLNNAGWGAGNRTVGDATSYDINYGNLLRIGGANTTTIPGAPILKPEEAWNIDTKMDDGKPAQGKVIATFWNNLCAAADDGSSANNDLVASYRLSDTTNQCSLYYHQIF